MGLNFRKSINLGKGFKLNIGKGSIGISGGVKGARISMNSKGRKTATFSIPGTGISYSLNLNKLFKGKKKGSDEKDNDNEEGTTININLVLVLIIIVLLVIIGAAAFAWFNGLI